ncbi:hypothetical protein JCM9492_10740 [Aquifex pyrophilus]
MDIQKILYENYVKRRGRILLEAKNPTEPKVGEVRLFLTDPPEWFLVINKEGELYTIVPLTSFVQLAITNKKPPVISWKKFSLVPLPFWVFGRKEILKKYSKPVFRINEKGLEKVREYVRTARTKGIGKWREKFIKAVYKRYEDLNLSSIAYTILKEESEENEVIVQFPTLLAYRLTERPELRVAAQPQNYLRGENWLGVVEGNKLIIYLPEELIGKRVRITLRGELIYEGMGEERIIIENLPELPSYSFLEEELDVQVLRD